MANMGPCATCCHGRVLLATLLPTAAGIVGDRRRHLDPWYTGLKKPSWTPPANIFMPIRAFFNAGIGCASYIVYKECGGLDGPAKTPLILYATHLALSISWCPVLFYTKNLDFGLVGMELVTLTAAITGHAFYQINKKAAYIFVPYVLWLGFATILTYNIRKLNKRAVTE